VPNDEIGGWAVSTDGRAPLDGGRMAADLVITREVAEHIADVHNAAIDGVDLDVYADNLRLRRELDQALFDKQNAINAAGVHAACAGDLYRQFVDPGTAAVRPLPQPTGFITTVDASAPPKPVPWEWVGLFALVAVLALIVVAVW